mmetsp:Transcript_32080/g.62745  ORF Transcript_32080/g.62745 Transcript_32080/m.62745 type:complete len:794 (-) Transcript_32080:260-2641(-)
MHQRKKIVPTPKTSSISGNNTSTIKSVSPPVQYQGFIILLFAVLVSFAFFEHMGIFLLVFVGAIFLAIEQAYPDQKLPKVKYWYLRAGVVNLSQLGLSQIGSVTWEKSAQRWTMFELGTASWATPLVGGFICYMAVTFVFYWWHRIRHESEFLWVSMHQMHHSAARMETITSFYKCPYEIVADSIVIALLHYTILGLGEKHMIYTAAFSVYGEFFYHMNIATPHWVGYFFQRPESHRIHHARDSQYLSKNYSDLPLWDMIFGTFENPDQKVSWDNFAIGFPEEDEVRTTEMMLLKNVRKPNTPWSKFGSYAYSSKLRKGSYAKPVLKRQNSEPLQTPDTYVRETLIFWAWFLLGIGYTVSGLDKVGCESWRDGTALRRVLENPLARDNYLRELMLATPPICLKLLTWASLGLEVCFGPLCLFTPSRRIVGVLMIGMHLGILFVINFTDLSFGVLMIHFFTLPTLLNDTRFDTSLSPEGRWGNTNFRTFLSVLGAYLFIHFAQLIPVAPDLWSNQGMLPDSSILPTRVFPNILANAEPWHTQAFLVFLGVLSVLLAFQINRIRPCVCVALWYGWACLWNRNVFISNPGLPYVGWTLLACSLWQEKTETELSRGELKRWRVSQWFRVGGAHVLGFIGCTSIAAFYLGSANMRGLAATTVASPLPLVFSKFNGQETFSTSFKYTAKDVNGNLHHGTVGPAMYSKVHGAYNYRNAFGVVFSHGPFFDKPEQLEMRRLVLDYAFCKPGVITRDSGLSKQVPLQAINVTVQAYPRQSPGDAENAPAQSWTMPVKCSNSE